MNIVRLSQNYGILIKKRFLLKVESFKLYNIYMIASTQIPNTKMFAFIALLVLKLLSRKVLFRNRKDNKNCQKVGCFLRK